MPKPYLFCNIGWMEQYKGITLTDKIIGGGGYVEDNKTGHEVCNFLDHQGFVFGYVRPSGGNQIKLERLGANKDDESLESVDVIITARIPKGSTVIIGWFKNAILYRSLQKLLSPSKIHVKNGISGFLYSARMEDVTLLSVDERTFEVPRGKKGGLGQSNVWYADKVDAEWMNQVRQLINGKNRLKPKLVRHSISKPDQALKIVVEKKAIETAWTHYEALGYTLKSVEKDNVGWDLEAESGCVCLTIEVKGLSSDTVNVELTPNEYKAFSKNQPNYRLCVVTRCLSNPILYVFRYNLPSKSWISETVSDNRILNIEQRVSASISFV